MFLRSGRAIAPLHFGALTLLSLTLLLVGSLVQGFAQGIDYTGTGGRHTIQGRIYFPSGRSLDITGVKVRLESVSASELTVFADLNGTFSFRNLNPGSYTVVIEAGKEYETIRETVYIDDPGSSGLRGSRSVGSGPARTFTVPIYLIAKRTAAPREKPGVVNAVLANIPKPAVELYSKGLESAQAGDSKKAVELFRAAISLYPEFALAFNELGVQYLKLKEPDKAVAALRSAVRLTPDAFAPQLNYATALIDLKEYAEAEAQLRQAMKKNESSWAAHMYLGVVLMHLHQLTEAQKEFTRTLEIGGDKLSLPHYYLAGIYWGARDYKRAADELETYLKLEPKSPDAEKTRATIKDLRSKH